ncbi:hypothetical protein BO86DRAFT_59900 [Aspergillus japonicus CBS 114.51]|uniref:Uncharacterized protein n=1 Tax=Aspergillus japonicus CBS 114.51 TaxID=1448312 RepID=A0A8T8X4I9_ASPJA|nr:hypothetical protein BO86DRAFT_59900 [Aspergillus japonicus CBS 114.51]RAH83057.1 hypothetical protein BO86DRAFT_59900 [Aspergillus japonicus CBS 114.51]
MMLGALAAFYTIGDERQRRRQTRGRDDGPRTSLPTDCTLLLSLTFSLLFSNSVFLILPRSNKTVPSTSPDVLDLSESLA